MNLCVILHMKMPPKVLEEPPTEMNRVEDRIKIMKDPTLTFDYIWRFDDGRDGIHIKIHAELKNKSTYEWDENEEWEWFVFVANSKENLNQEDYVESISTRSFREALLYANEYAENITDVELKIYSIV